MFPPAIDARQILFRLDLTANFFVNRWDLHSLSLGLFRGWRCWSVLLLIWLIAVIGIYLRLVYFESISYVVGTSIFIAMGWVGGFSGLLIRFQYGAGHIGPLLVGGVCYTLGAILDSANWPFVIPAVTGPHEILHLLVLADLGCHWSFISRIASEKTSSAVAKVVHKNGYSEGSPPIDQLNPQRTSSISQMQQEPLRRHRTKECDGFSRSQDGMKRSNRSFQPDLPPADLGNYASSVFRTLHYS